MEIVYDGRLIYYFQCKDTEKTLNDFERSVASNVLNHYMDSCFA